MSQTSDDTEEYMLQHTLQHAAAAIHLTTHRTRSTPPGRAIPDLVRVCECASVCVCVFSGCGCVCKGYESERV